MHSNIAVGGHMGYEHMGYEHMESNLPNSASLPGPTVSRSRGIRLPFDSHYEDIVKLAPMGV